MNALQLELDALDTPTPIQIVGVNQDGHQLDDYDATGKFCDGRDLPFLEENAGDEVWQLWKVTYRDVIVLDENNEVLDVYNLTDNTLGETANYEALKEILVTAAGGDGT